MNMNINLNDGSILLEGSLLRNGDGIEKIRSTIGKEIDRNDVGTGWIHYIYGDIKILEFYPVSIAFSLKNNSLSYVSIGSYDKEKSILELKAQHEEMAEKISKKKPDLIDNSGHYFIFHWGKINSFYDLRTEFSQVLLSWK